MGRAVRMTVALTLAVVAANEAAGDTLWNPETDLASLFMDRKATRVGDVLIVLISESASASHQASGAYEKATDSKVGPGVGQLSFIPFVGFDAKSQTKAKAASSRSDLLVTRVAVTITGITENGNLLVEGTRHIVVNKDYQRITLQGEVRPRDVRRDNTVLSQNVANARIEYHGPAARQPGRRVGLIPRILNWLW